MSEIIAGVRMEKGPTILLNSGHYFDLLEPDRSHFTERDLILGMSRECRFAGQCEPYYSVAEHSRFVSETAEREGGDWQACWDAAWHDSPEGIIRDIVRPQKMLLPDYKLLEARVEGSIFPRLGVTFPLPGWLKDLDLRAQYCEKAQIEPHRTHWPREGDPLLPFKIHGLEQRNAGEWFAGRIGELRRRGPDWVKPAGHVY